MAPALWLGRGHPSNRWISVDRYDLMRDCKICVDNLFVFTLARNPNRQNATIVTHTCHCAHGQERHPRNLVNARRRRFYRSRTVPPKITERLPRAAPLVPNNGALRPFAQHLTCADSEQTAPPAILLIFQYVEVICAQARHRSSPPLKLP